MASGRVASPGRAGQVMQKRVFAASDKTAFLLLTVLGRIPLILGQWYVVAMPPSPYTFIRARWYLPPHPRLSSHLPVMLGIVPSGGRCD